MSKRTLFLLYLLLPSLLANAQVDIKCTSTENVADGSFSYPSYHSVGKYFIAQQRVGSFLQLFRINTDKTVQQLTSDSAHHSHAAVSENGEWIAYTKEQNGQRDIFLFHPDRGEHLNLTNTASYNEAHPSWGDDDTVIIYNTNQYDSLQEIASISVKDRIVRRLTMDHEEDTYGSISPDGKKLLYTKWLEKEKNPETYILFLQDGKERRITNNQLRDVAPIWISDTLITYTQAGSIIFYNLTTGVEKRVMTETGFFFGRGVKVSNSSLLCERTKDRKPDGLSILHF